MKRILILTLITSVNYLFSQTQSFSFERQKYYIDSNLFADHVAMADLNHDRLNDIAIAIGYPKYEFMFYYQDTSGFFDSVLIYPFYSNSLQTPTIASGDVTGDHLDDIVLGIEDSIYIYSQVVDKIYFLYSLPAGKNVRRIKIDDIDQDGIMDICIISESPYVKIYYGELSKAFTAYDYPIPKAGQDDLEIGKIGDDSLISILKMNGKGFNPAVTRLRVGKDRKVMSEYSYRIAGDNPFLPHGIFIIDWNHDGKKEFGVTFGIREPNAFIGIWGNVNTINPDTVFKVKDTPEAVRSGDFNGDGKEEIAVLHGGYNLLTIHSKENKYEQYFMVNCPYHTYPDGLVVGDISRDGILDIVCTNAYGGLNVLTSIKK